MDIRRTILVGIILMGVALTAGCAPAAQGQPVARGDALAGTGWVLVSLNGHPPLEGTVITLRFGDTAVEGSGGCNTYGGSYTTSEDSLNLSGLYWTEMACPEPEGVLEQEQAYFQALYAAARYRMEDERLILQDDDGTQILEYGASTADAPVAQVRPTETAPGLSLNGTPDADEPSAAGEPADLRSEPRNPTEPPAGFRRYVHGPSGVSLWVPESWTVIEPGPHGGPTILQSYPQDAYIGGEPRRPGDTKCDLTVHPPGTRTADLIQSLKSGSHTTVVSEREVILSSGRSGARFEVESMGRSLSLIAALQAAPDDERAVVLTCFGESARFDEISMTLGSSE